MTYSVMNGYHSRVNYVRESYNLFIYNVLIVVYNVSKDVIDLELRRNFEISTN